MYTWQNTWESDSRRPGHPGALDDEELFVIEGFPKSPLNARTESEKMPLKKGKKTTSDFRAETCWNFGCVFTAARPHVDELHLRHQHGFLHCLNQLVVEHERACQQLSKNCTDCNCGSSTVFGTVNPNQQSLYNNGRVPTNPRTAPVGSQRTSAQFALCTCLCGRTRNPPICRRTESEAPPRTRRRTAGT